MPDPFDLDEYRRRVAARRAAVDRANAEQGRSRLRALARAARGMPSTGRGFMPSDRQLAWAAIIVLVLAMLAVVADAKGGDRVDRMPQLALERAAIRSAATGGIRSHRYADASPWLRRLSRELVARAFHGDSRRWALCVVNRESGFNPGAISSTDDHGLPQINRPSHPWVDYPRIVVDPVYAVAVMRRLSDGGRDRSPWGGC